MRPLAAGYESIGNVLESSLFVPDPLEIRPLERHAAVYEEWQEVDGLVVPKKISFYVWSDEKLGEGPAGFMVFENVSFKDGSPDSALFSKPDGAEVDNSHMQQ